MVRIGMAAPGRFHERGWHTTAVCGAFGAALAAGKSLGLDADRLTAALGVAASMVSGVMEFLEDGSWVERLHPGWAAQSGIQAAALAGEGFTGRGTALEGRLGLYRAALGEAPDIEKHLKNLWDEWETLRSLFKLYPCCHLNHAYLDAVLRLKRIEEFRAEQVAGVECLVPAGEVPIVCEPVAAKLRPRTPYDAKFSLAFCVAATLAGDRVGIGAFTGESIREPRVLALAARVRYTVDPLSPYPRTFPGWVAVGPELSSLLAEFGAEVIKVESSKRLDYCRLIPTPLREGEDARRALGARAAEVDRVPLFHQYNRGKLGVTVDLRHPGAPALIKRMVAGADVVVENFSLSVLRSAGLDYPALSAVRPGLIMISCSAVGSGGPWEDMRTFAPSLTSLSGLERLIGYAGERALGALTLGYGDPSNAHHGFFAVLAALAHRARRARGSGST